MLHTIETRWFGQGEIPSEISDWFGACPGPAELQPLRRDHYLRNIDGDGLSLKLREGGLEIKQRRYDHGLVRLHGSIEGLVEAWVKWRFPLDQAIFPFPAAIDGSGNWFAVEKRRRLRRYGVGGRRLVPLIAPPGAAYAGCDLELTSVRAGGDLWWTVAFESASQGQNGLDRLLALTGLAFAETTPPQLLASNSFSYPLWLASSFDHT